MEFTEVDALLSPSPLALETGYERLPDGVLHVAVRTDMHGCTGEMFQWWFRWRCDTQKYVWWHPVDHVSSAWAGTLSDHTHVGSEHQVVERLTGLPAMQLTIQFREPAEFFDETAHEVARKTGDVSCTVLARISEGQDPPRRPDGAVLGGRLLHVGRDTRWGLALRSHFYLGVDAPQDGVTPQQLTSTFPDELGAALLQHAYNEFTFLSRFLPALFVAEHRDVRPVPVPW